VACYGPMVVSVWRLVKHILYIKLSVWRRCICLTCAWCHFERPVEDPPIHRFTPHRVLVRGCIVILRVTHVTGIAYEASTTNIRVLFHLFRDYR